MLHQNLFYNDDHQATCLLRSPGGRRPEGAVPGSGRMSREGEAGFNTDFNQTAFLNAFFWCLKI